MFNCKKCLTLESEVLFLREQVKSLGDRVLALTNPIALAAVTADSDDGEDLYVEQYTQFGEKILVKQ